MGFGVPLTEWLRAACVRFWKTRCRRWRRRGLLESHEIRRLTSEHLSGAADHRDRLWLLLVLELWWRRLYEGLGGPALQDRLGLLQIGRRVDVDGVASRHD